MVVQVQLPKANMGPPIVTKLTSDFVWYCTTKYTCLKIVLKERAEIVYSTVYHSRLKFGKKSAKIH